MQYEKNPGNGSPGYLAKSLIFFQGEFWADAYSVNSRIPSYYTKLLWSGDDPPFPYSWDGISYWNSTTPGLSYVFGHGSPWQYAVRTQSGIHERYNCHFTADWMDNWPSPDYNGLDNLTTASRPLVAYSISCMNGSYEMQDAWYNNYPWFKDTTIVEGHLTTYPNTCGSAWLGYSRYGYTGGISGELAYQFTDVLYGSAQRAGITEGVSKTRVGWQTDWYYYYIIMSHNLFGDPEMVIYTAQPAQLVASPNPQLILVNQPTDITVTVTVNQQPMGGAYVCLFKWGEVNLTGWTDFAGQVTFYGVTAYTEGYIQVTVTKDYNFLPGQSTIQVWSGPGPGGGQSAGLAKPGIPTRYGLGPIAPSPFSNRTAVHYQLPKQGEVDLRVYDVSGRLVKSLVKQKVSAGYYSAEWDGKDASGRDIPAGVYFVKFRANEYESLQKAVVVR